MPDKSPLYVFEKIDRPEVVQFPDWNAVVPKTGMRQRCVEIKVRQHDLPYVDIPWNAPTRTRKFISVSPWRRDSHVIRFVPFVHVNTAGMRRSSGAKQSFHRGKLT